MKIAKLEDVPKLTKLLCKDLSETFTVKQSRISDLLNKIVTGENSDAWISKNGFMFGVIQPSIYGPNVMVANCLYFRGLSKDKKVFEEWAKEKSANMIMFNLLKANKTMSKNGYKAIETRYVKEI
jgi:hypothetical protein